MVAAVFVGVTLRFGFLPLMVYRVFVRTAIPITTNFSAWYEKPEVMQIGLILIVTAWAARNALKRTNGNYGKFARHLNGDLLRPT